MFFGQIKSEKIFFLWYSGFTKECFLDQKKRSFIKCQKIDIFRRGQSVNTETTPLNCLTLLKKKLWKTRKQSWQLNIINNDVVDDDDDDDDDDSDDDDNDIWDYKYNSVKFPLSFIFSWERFSYPITFRFSQKGEYYKKYLTKLNLCIFQPTIFEGVIHLNFEYLYPVWPCSKVVCCSYLQTM